jgi:molybdate-binding protein/transcriptional regulator with XRE-family HTH domain
MPELPKLENRVRDHRERRGWSQEELARRSGLSRAGISAIETGRLVPSAAAALALASAFGRRVEDLFRLSSSASEPAVWAWNPRRTPCRYWRAEVAGRERLYPVEANPLGVVPHDGVWDNGACRDEGTADPSSTLVIACCDPAVGLLADVLARSAGVRLLVLPRSSRAALGLLEQGLVHAAGLHLGAAGAAEGNAEVVQHGLGPGFQLLRVARWEEGVAFAPALQLPTVREATIRANLRWVGREPGSGARQCLDELLAGRPLAPEYVATDHRGVAEAVRLGWAEAGVCLRLTSEEAGLDFLSVREEAYDLCFPNAWKDDPRLRSLLDAVRTPSYRRGLGALPGYNTAETGELQPVG